MNRRGARLFVRFGFPLLRLILVACAHLWEGINYKNGEEDDDDDDNNRRYSDDTSPSTVSLAHVAEGRKRIPARGCDCLYQIIH